MKSHVAFLNMPLFKTNSLDQGDVLVGKGFDDHDKIKDSWDEEDLLMWASI